MKNVATIEKQVDAMTSGSVFFQRPVVTCDVVSAQVFEVGIGKCLRFHSETVRKLVNVC
jgi:hypothetical protein